MCLFVCVCVRLLVSLFGCCFYDSLFICGCACSVVVPVIRCDVCSKCIRLGCACLFVCLFLGSCAFCVFVGLFVCGFVCLLSCV